MTAPPVAESVERAVRLAPPRRAIGAARARFDAWRRAHPAPTILIRWKLTIFYCAVLALTLTSFSVLVYLYMRQSLLTDIHRASQERAAEVSEALIREAERQDKVRQARELGFLEGGKEYVLSALGVLQEPFEPWRYEGVGVRYYHITGRLIGASDKFLTDAARMPTIDRRLVLDANHGYDHSAIVRAADDGGVFYSYSRPVFNKLGIPFAIVEVLTSLQPYNNTMDRLTRLLIAGTLLATALAFVSGAAVTEAALRPIDTIARTAQRINEERDLSRRIANQGPPDEIGRLASTVNDMLDQIEGMFDRQRRFLADVSHELRTPLTTIRGEIELMRRAGRLDEEGAEAVHGEAERMSRMVGDLLLLARTGEGTSGKREPVALDGLVHEVHRQAQRLAGDHHAVELRHADAATVLGDGDQLKQLLLNLVSNALQHTPAGTHISIGVYREGSGARIEVADDGPGIPAADLPYVFDRFYRVDKARARASGGSGLGLAIVHAIAKAHGGDVTVESAPPRGTTFTVRLPSGEPKRNGTGRNGAPRPPR